MEKRQVGIEEASQMGVSAKHEQMGNGEFRFRLMSADGSGYILTVAGPEGAWQNAHYHTDVRELYAVQQGQIAFVEMKNGAHQLRILREGETVITEPGVAHNVYMFTGTKVHTVKFGDTSAELSSGKADWHACPELDALTKHLTEDDINRMTSS